MRSGKIQQQDQGLKKLALDLRQLRASAGNPILYDLASQTGISKSTISDALQGKKLPSDRTLASLVKALGDDPGPWLERRDQLALNATGNSSASELPVEKARPRRLIPLRAAAIAAAGAFGAGIIGTVGVVALLDGVQSNPSAVATPADPTLSAVTTGVDPASTPCIEDAEPAAGETRNESYLLEVIWSENCDAAWGRVTRYDNRSSGNSVHVEISSRDGDEGHQKQEATIGDVQGAYTALIIRADGNTRLCARGSVTVDGATIDLGDPLCI